MHMAGQGSPHTFRVHSRPGRSMGAGIGLVLALVVMLITMAMYFGTFGGKSYMQTVASGRQQAIEMKQDIETQQLLACIVAYQTQHNRLPKTAEELDAGPSLNDPWRKPMTFTYKKGEGNAAPTFVVWRSAGPDGQMNTPDDIVKEDKLLVQP
jgi:hypothetical protein